MKILYESLYASIYKSQFVETLYQTPAKEYWFRAIAIIKQFLTKTTIADQINSIIFTHNPHILDECLDDRPNPGQLDNWNQTAKWVFVPKTASLLTSKLLPIQTTQIVKLDQNDTLATEWFCLLITQEFSILILSSAQHHSCLFSLYPEPVGLAIMTLKARINNQQQKVTLEKQLQNLPLQTPPYQVMGRFATLLITQPINQELPVPEIQEVEIIKAITHEVKTPLTTIRTLVQSLLRRKDIAPQVHQRLKQIDFECRDQIERFNLIFEAVRPNVHISLELTYLEQILQESIGLWEEQAKRRQLGITINMPSKLPAIASNSKLLNQLLNGLVDKLTRSLPPDSHIKIQVTIMGGYLKVQFQSNFNNCYENREASTPLLEAVGQWLMIQPETGTLSLSLLITKTLFQALGGRLIIRTHPTNTYYDGEILTIFLPVYQD